MRTQTYPPKRWSRRLVPNGDGPLSGPRTTPTVIPLPQEYVGTSSPCGRDIRSTIIRRPIIPRPNCRDFAPVSRVILDQASTLLCWRAKYVVEYLWRLEPFDEHGSSFIMRDRSPWRRCDRACVVHANPDASGQGEHGGGDAKSSAGPTSASGRCVADHREEFCKPRAGGSAREFSASSHPRNAVNDTMSDNALT